MNYYNEIKNELINNEVTKKVKDYSKNKSDLDTYYNVGKLLTLAGSNYGEGIIKEYSNKLTKDLNKKYDVSSLNKMRKFYNLSQKMVTVSPNLSYSHYVELLPYNDINKINFYIMISEKLHLSVRQLREKIKNKEYERLPEKTKYKLITNEEIKVQDIIKNPIIIHNPNDIEVVTEKTLHKLILEDMPSFLKELWSDFAFIDSEYKIKIGSDYHYIDFLLFTYLVLVLLLFLLFNIEYNCYIVIELKVTKLKKEHIGQIGVYMNYIDSTIRKPTQDKTIGIIISSKNNKFIMEYCSDPRILSKEYELV